MYQSQSKRHGGGPGFSPTDIRVNLMKINIEIWGIYKYEQNVQDLCIQTHAAYMLWKSTLKFGEYVLKYEQNVQDLCIQTHGATVYGT